MRLSRLALSALFCLGAPATAWAQDGGVQISLTSSVGVTDNVNQTPDDPPEGVEKEAGGTFDVSPGFAFNYITPRTTNRLAYTFTYGFLLERPEENSIANALTYSSQFETSPTTSLALGLTGTHGRTQEVTGVDDPATATLGASPTEPSYYFRADASQGFTKALSPNLEIGQGLTGGAFFPLDDVPSEPVSYSAGLSLNGTTSFRDDSFGLTLSSAYTYFKEVEAVPNADPAAAVAGEEARHVLLNSVTGTWTRDWTDRWSTNLGLGVTVTVEDDDATPAPTGQASVLYTREEYQAELSYSSATQPNVETGDIVFANTATLRAALPIFVSTHHAVTTSASGGFQNSQPIGGTDDGVVTNIFLADAALIWTPLSLPIDYEMSLRYQFTRQDAGDGTDPGENPDDPADDAIIPGEAFSRHTVLLAITVAYDNRAREVTPLITGPYRRQDPEPPRPRPEPIPAE